ncbi:MAG: Spy/CpxP family protein refolding chaperone [Proteobacteria bacterium]|uniref:Spy/CpxP family protein refolding chaperone n=1 Tax=Aquabacterium sp. TaxID=1872578 RepID=UPI0035C7146A|nr:Spy/CpxP family protein refolding chaperone [Pseudomonadota bacterium]
MPSHTPAPVSAMSLRGTSLPMRHLLLTGVLALGAAFASTPSPAADKPADKAPAATASAPARMAPGMHHGGPMDMHGGMGMHDGMGGGMGMMPFGRHLDRLLDDVKATDAQRQQIKQITDKARGDVMALHEQGRGLHERAAALWTTPKIDATEAEKVRQQMLAQHDQVSKRMMQAMLDVGQVLTPEQRAKAAQLMKERHERMAERWRERGGPASGAAMGRHRHGDQPKMDR